MLLRCGHIGRPAGSGCAGRSTQTSAATPQACQLAGAAAGHCRPLRSPAHSAPAAAHKWRQHAMRGHARHQSGWHCSHEGSLHASLSPKQRRPRRSRHSRHSRRPTPPTPPTSRVCTDCRHMLWRCSTDRSAPWDSGATDGSSAAGGTGSREERERREVGSRGGREQEDGNRAVYMAHPSQRAVPSLLNPSTIFDL